MAYSTSNPPSLMVGTAGNGANGMRLFGYSSTHALAALTTAAGFVTNGKQLGMTLGDLLFAKSTAGFEGICEVSAVSSTGATLVILAT